MPADSNRSGMLRPLCGLLFALAWAWTYAAHFSELVLRWSTDDNSYCFLVPLVAAYLGWNRREEIRRRMGGPAWPGAILVLAAALVYTAGRAGSLESLVYFSMWLSACGGILMWFGTRALRPLAFPLFVLLFAVPPPPYVIRLLTFRLRLASSALAVWVLSWLGVPALRSGNIIDLGDVQLHIVDACSGLRFFFPLVLMVLVAGNLFRTPAFKVCLLLAAGVVLSVLANAARIAGLGLASGFLSPEVIEGVGHDLSGWIAFILSAGLLVVAAYAWRGPEKRSGPALAGPWPMGARSCAALVLGAVVLAGGQAGYKALAAGAEPPARESFVSFPMRIGHWDGVHLGLAPAVVDELWTDDYLAAAYRNQDTGNRLQLLIAYYARQTTRKTAHAPTSCLLGGGFSIESQGLIPPDPAHGRDFPVSRLVLEKNGQRIISCFWFEQRGRHITGELANKFMLIRDALAIGRSDGALVRVEMVLNPGQGVEQGQELMDDFLGHLKKILDRYVPGGAQMHTPTPPPGK